VSERGSGVGPFLLGVVLGALAGVLFAPARGDVTRRRIGRRVGDLKDLAEEKYDALTAGDAGDEDEEEDAEAGEEPSTREELERRLREARRRRRAERAARTRRGPLEEDDEPVA
jgi:gas vesicle protein